MIRKLMFRYIICVTTILINFLLLSNCSTSENDNSTIKNEIPTKTNDKTNDKPEFDKDNIALLNNSYDSDIATTFSQYYSRASGSTGIIGRFCYRIRTGTPGKASYYSSDTYYVFKNDGTFTFSDSEAYGFSGGYNTTKPSTDTGFYNVYKLKNEEYFFYITMVGEKSGTKTYRYRVSDNCLVFTTTEDLSIDDYTPNDLFYSLNSKDNELSNRCAYKRKYNGDSQKDGFLGTWAYGIDEVETWGNSIEGRHSYTYYKKNFELIFTKEKTISYREYLIGDDKKEKEVYNQTGNFELVSENEVNYIIVNFANGVHFKYKYLISSNYLLFLDNDIEKNVLSIIPKYSKDPEIGDILINNNYFLKADDIGLGFNEKIQGFVWEISNNEITIMTPPSNAMAFSSIEDYKNSYSTDIVSTWKVPSLADVNNEYKETRYYIALSIYKLERVGILKFRKCSIWLSDVEIDNKVSINETNRFHMIYNIDVFCVTSGLISRSWYTDNLYCVALLGKMKV